MKPGAQISQCGALDSPLPGLMISTGNRDSMGIFGYLGCASVRQWLRRQSLDVHWVG